MGGGITLKPGLPTLIYEQKEQCSSIGQLVLGNPHKSMISSTMTLYKQVKSKIRFKKRQATGTNTGKTEVKSVTFQKPFGADDITFESVAIPSSSGVLAFWRLGVFLKLQV